MFENKKQLEKLIEKKNLNLLLQKRKKVRQAKTVGVMLRIN